VRSAVLHSLGRAHDLRAGEFLLDVLRHEPEPLRGAVYDTGPGIARELHGTVFEEFYQVGNREQRSLEGLGLGLAIVARLAKLLAIPVTLVSEQEGGRCSPSICPGCAMWTSQRSRGVPIQSGRAMTWRERWWS
jgi:hypothetical protein